MVCKVLHWSYSRLGREILCSFCLPAQGKIQGSTFSQIENKILPTIIVFGGRGGLGRGPCSFNVQSLKVHLLMCVFVYYILCPECSDDGGSGGGGGLLCRVEV